MGAGQTSLDSTSLKRPRYARKNKMENFNRYMLELARDSRGMTQKDLCERISITQATLSKYENGLHQPPPEFIDDVAHALGYPGSFFYEAERPYGFPPFHYRKRKKLSSKIQGKIIAEMNIKRMHIKNLLRSYAINARRRIPELDKHEYVRGGKIFNIEDAARAVREHWMLPRGPVRNLMEIIESCGGIVVECDFGTDLLDAMSQRIDGMPVLFFVNRHAPADRLRYTLAHELGHMIMHTIDIPGLDEDEIEEEADAFAGAFLLPSDEIRPQLRKFDFRQLAALKLHWGVSIAALAVRADRLGMITQYQKKSFWIDYNKSGYRNGEPAEIPRERPGMLNNMINFHMKELGYTIADMAKFLHLTEGEFSESYLGRPALRVVK
jgi:Zn-dependent peptidase ImmA (M78 family)